MSEPEGFHSCVALWGLDVHLVWHIIGTGTACRERFV